MKSIGVLLVAFIGAVSLHSARAYELNILHLNDHHSHLGTNHLDLQLGGRETRVSSGGFPAVATVMSDLASTSPNVLKLHAGDAVSAGPYYLQFKGEADAALMNFVCFDAFTVGNHEFDDGDTGLVTFIENLHDDSCRTPVLGANVKPEVGVSPLARNSATDYLLPATVLERSGERIGIIGIVAARKTKRSSRPDPTTEFLDETNTAQAQIDRLREQGINKIVLLTHVQYRNDISMAQELSGVDVIVGGDSHTLLGVGFQPLGLDPAGEYPTVVRNRDGETVCIVQAWEYSNIVGALSVTFDDSGRVTRCTGTPHLLLGDSFKRRNDEQEHIELDGPERDEVLAEIKANPLLYPVSVDPAAQQVLNRFSEDISLMNQTRVASAAHALCSEDLPGQGRSNACSREDTASNGSDISNIIAKAFLQISRTSDIAIQNAGGARTDILPGTITVGDAYALLPFDNTLVEMTMTGAEIIQVLEEALDFALSEDGATGAYPYAAGLRWTVNLSRSMGNRFSNVEINPGLSGSWTAIDPVETYQVIANSYLAAGKDGYATFRRVSERGDARNTYLDYAQPFIDYARAAGTLQRLPVSEYSTQVFINPKGEIQ